MGQNLREKGSLEHRSPQRSPGAEHRGQSHDSHDVSFIQRSCIGFNILPFVTLHWALGTDKLRTISNDHGMDNH